tara:strand:+ start:388 stop:1629 length:1242 start_codon:yes stop_codon:yes gene_type:complete
MMTNIQPQPLFDNLQWFSPNEYHPCVRDYLSTIAIPGILDEYHHALRFLYSYRGSYDTFNSYRREIERLCQWCWLIKQSLIRDIDRHAIEEYFDFVINPPKNWVSESHSQRFNTGDDGVRVPCAAWRPFLNRRLNKNMSSVPMGLSQSSLRAIISGTSTFFTYLQQENYLDKNPVMLIRQKSQLIQKQQHTRITRKLNDVQWHFCVREIEKSCAQNVDYERLLFIFSAFFLMGLRISELADSPNRQVVMSDFFRDSSDLWWFRSVGKGNKMREIAVCDAMLDQLRRYRKYLGLSGLPKPHESIPMIPKLKGLGGIGIRQLRKLVQNGFDLTVDALRLAGRDQDADDMRSATVHWLRHTAISKDVIFRPREHVRDDAGHQSVQVTDRYIEVDMQARHATARGKKLINFEGTNDI